MNQLLTTLVVNNNLTLKDIIREFENSTNDLVLVDQNSVIAQPHMELLSDYPRSVSAALVSKIKNGDTFIQQDRVVSASSSSHQVTFGNSFFLGALRLSQKQRTEIVDALSKADAHNVLGHAIDLTLVALVRATIEVTATNVWAAPYARTFNELDKNLTRKEIDKINPDKIRLLIANRSNDGFFSVFVLRKFSKLLTKLAVKIRATPNQVTLVSLVIGLYAAYSFAKGDLWSIFVGALLLQISLVVDCVDGELARYTRQFSDLGRWLDALTDRVKEYSALFGLAYGAFRLGNDFWILAIVLMVIQTVRHLSDYNFAEITKVRMKETFKNSIAFTEKFDAIVKPAREPRVGLRYWLSKIIQFPIGERWIVISTASIIGGAFLTFTLMPILTLISAFVVIRGRIIVSRKIFKNIIESALIVNQLDLFILKKNLLNRFSWVEPSILRVIEFALLLAIFIGQELVGITTFIIIFSISFHHYDNLYRALAGSEKPKWLTLLGLFVEGRILVITIFIFTGWPLIWIACYLGVIFMGISPIQWIIDLAANKIRQ